MKNKLALILSLLLLTACTAAAQVDMIRQLNRAASIAIEAFALLLPTTVCLLHGKALPPTLKALPLSFTVQAVLFTFPTPETPPAILMPKARLQPAASPELLSRFGSADSVMEDIICEPPRILRTA